MFQNPFQPTFQRPLNNGFYPGFASSGPMFYPGHPNGFQGGPMQYTPTYPQFPFFQPGFFGAGGGQRMSVSLHCFTLSFRLKIILY